jgi:hypothetical protein
MIVKDIAAVWRKRDLLQPRDDVGKIIDRSRSVCIAGTDRSREWLKRQGAAVKGCYGSWVKTFWLAEATRVSAEDKTTREGLHTL